MALQYGWLSLVCWYFLGARVFALILATNFGKPARRPCSHSWELTLTASDIGQGGKIKQFHATAKIIFIFISSHFRPALTVFLLQGEAEK
jgi:hypothetical protein